MLKLENTEKYILSFKRYHREIDQINNTYAKDLAQKLLTDLKAECRLITEAHNPNNTKSVDPRTARDSIRKSVEIRRNLEKVIKDSKEC
jgi:hypothetical protein